MRLIADLHIHSHFSRATSPNLTFEYLTRWAQLKGIHVVGTGDVAHPGWLAEMREKLVPAEDGLYRLKDELAAAVQAQVPPACHSPVRFILGGEISNIYKRGGQTRKVHNVVFAPSFDAVERLQARLERIGNIRSDGRPILGLDSRDLLEIVLDTDPACHLIPAHIWTPWFSLLGSKSGFDSVAECFADLTPHIFALETGLSSDPPMNWRVSGLDRYTLVSNSDAHSPEKLGRETTLFDCELAYGALFEALKYAGRLPSPAHGRGVGGEGYLGTVEFFPEEGKYHFDGHRACNIVWDPPTTRAHNEICPVCGKQVTVGVMHRVEALADRPEGYRPAGSRPFHSLIPLPEVLGEVYGVGASSKQVQAEYFKLLVALGAELSILREKPLGDITKVGGGRLAEGIGRMRRGEVVAQPGYDGEYGVIRVFAATHVAETQMGLFGDETVDRGAENVERKAESETAFHERRPSYETVYKQAETAPVEVALHSTLAATLPPEVAPLSTLHAPLSDGLNDEQRAAVLCTDAPLVIVAGPGTGKTRTLTVRIAHLILEKQASPENILAITFTNKAADEMRERLDDLLGAEIAGRVTIKTFHAFGAMLLRQHANRLDLSPEFVILAEEDRAALLRQACPELKAAEIEAALAQISAVKAVAGDGPRLKSGSDMPNPLKRIDEDSDQPASAGLASQAAVSTADPAGIHDRYDAALRASDAVDFDDLIHLPIRLLEECPDVLAAIRARYRWISVDEYQDVNAAQYRLLRLLAGEGVNLCVIGDPDQAIYGFRGADHRYFLRFAQDYPGAVRLSLSRNYRSSQRILDAASQVIARNPDRNSVEILAEFADEVKLDIYRAPTDKAEAEYVVHQIEQMVGGISHFSLDSARVTGEAPAAAHSFADFAVLYRLSAQARLLGEAFNRSGIPYQTIGQAPLASHKAVREVLAHLWQLYNPHSSAHEGQLVDLSHTQAVLFPELEQAHRAGAPVTRLIEQIMAGIAARRRKPYADADAQRLHQLTLRAVPFEDRLGDFLETIALQSETDAYDPRADRVTLMSLHASKGLEFPVVFIVGCEEGLLPYERKGETVDVEEERRLFYVGLTRAGRKLVLIHARKRVLFGQFRENPPSRFVGDIEAALKEVQEMKYRPPERKPESGQMSLF
jgi:DNA helicase II / ATP-dependent DNA helicase PcrA